MHMNFSYTSSGLLTLSNLCNFMAFTLFYHLSSMIKFSFFTLLFLLLSLLQLKAEKSESFCTISQCTDLGCRYYMWNKCIVRTIRMKYYISKWEKKIKSIVLYIGTWRHVNEKFHTRTKLSRPSPSQICPSPPRSSRCLSSKRCQRLHYGFFALSVSALEELTDLTS
jgi:hypothetical protein